MLLEQLFRQMKQVWLTTTSDEGSKLSGMLWNSLENSGVEYL